MDFHVACDDCDVLGETGEDAGGVGATMGDEVGIIGDEAGNQSGSRKETRGAEIVLCPQV